MDISHKGHANNNDTKITLSNKVKKLNPNAAEFVPSAFLSAHENETLDASSVDQKDASGKAVLDSSESTVSNNSDDEAYHDLRYQLPDDITPDFKDMGEVELPGAQQLSLAGLSIHDGVETPRFSPSRFSETFSPGQNRSLRSTGRLNLNGNLGNDGSIHTEDQSFTSSVALASQYLDQVNMVGDQQLISGMEGHRYNGASRASFINNLLADQAVLEKVAINPLAVLASRFPRLSADRLADVYYANGCNLNLTIEMLRQLELQGDDGFRNNTEVLATPRLATSNFSALPVVEASNGLSKYVRTLQQTPNVYRSTSNISKDTCARSSNSSQLLASLFHGHGKLLYGGDISGSLGTARTAPVWPETDRAVGNMFSDSREEARDYARLRDTCLEQVSRAYLVDNKALSREPSEKGQLYNLQVKAALRKAGEAVHQQRNPFSSQIQGGQERVIDLRSLHVGEALHVLEHELSDLRRAARSSGQLLQAMILTGHADKGFRTPQRLPMAVEHYLMGEGIRYTQPQPGLFCVVIF